MLESKQRPHIDEIVFTDDFLRVPENGMLATCANRRMLRELFGASAERLGWRVREAYTTSQGGNISVRELMVSLGLPRTPAGWAAAGIADLCGVADHLDALTLAPSSLVIGWSMPPSVLQYLDRQGVAFIDVELHSVRFTRDLYLAMRTNDAGIQAELNRYRVSEDVFWAGAASLRAHYARRGNASIVHPNMRVGLFAGQMDIDMALVEDGNLKAPADYVEDIAMWAKSVDLLAICPHPAMPDASLLHPLLDRIPNAMLVRRDTYSLLCAHNLTFAAALSSGVLTEARYLGCNDTRRLLVDDRNSPSRVPSNCSLWIPVHLEVTGAQALRAFSQSRSETENALDKASPTKISAFPQETLSRIFGYHWGLDPSANGLPHFPTLAPGETLKISRDSPGGISVNFGRGWSELEYWGVWSSETRASLVVVLDGVDGAPPDYALDLSFCGQRYGQHGLTPPTVHIVVNGKKCEYVPGENAIDTWRVRLEHNALQRSVLNIAIEVCGTYRQCDVGAPPDDKRHLGLGLYHISLQEVAVPESTSQSEPATVQEMPPSESTERPATTSPGQA